MITKISYEKGAKPTKFTLKKSEFEYNVKDETLYTIGKQGELITIVSVKSITDAFLAVDGVLTANANAITANANALTANANALTAHKNLNIMFRSDSVTRTFGTTWGSGVWWPPFYKSVGTNVMVHWRCPFRNDSQGWGGGYINIYVTYDGWATTHTLGDSGYDGGVMNSGARAIGSMSGSFLLDSDRARNATQINIRFIHRSYDGTVTINGSHNIASASTGEPHAFFSHITIQEVEHNVL